MKLFLFVFLISFSSIAKDCTYSIKPEDIKLTWTAYKTPLKAGVSGSFDRLGVAKKIHGKSLNDLISGIKFKIETSSVNSNNPDRDKKLAGFFFAPLGAYITGATSSYKKKVLKVDITMNNVTKAVPLKVTFEPESFEANGAIDILDFNGSVALKAINQACLELHEGKTWNDVALKLEAKYSKSCKK